MSDVAVVVLDTLRLDAFQRRFEWLPGRRYTNAYAPGHWTVPVHGAMFTGLYPSEVGVHAKAQHLDTDRRVLAERLAAAGYTTRAFSANPYVSPVFGFDRGFEEFEGSWRLRQLDPALFDWTRFSDETAEEGPTRYLRALARCVRGDCATLSSLRFGLRLKLRESDPFGGVADDGAQATLEYVRETSFGSEEFLYLNLMEAHTPYDPPADYTTTDVTHGGGLEGTITGDDVDPAPVRQAYDDCVRYLSDVYERIYAALAEEFHYVLTVSDHGELLGEHGGWAHGYGLFPELTNVPVVLSGPDVADGTSTELVSLLDVHATVQDAAGIDADSRGRSLLGEQPMTDCLTEYHGLTARRVEKLEDAGVPADLIAEYDQTFRGIAGPSDYGYRTPEGFVATGTADVDPEDRLATLVTDLDVAEPTGDDDSDHSDDVISQLEDLGYA